jgi:hypothetical protein
MLSLFLPGFSSRTVVSASSTEIIFSSILRLISIIRFPPVISVIRRFLHQKKYSMLSVFKQIPGPPGRKTAEKRDSVKKDCGEEELPGRKTAEKRDSVKKDCGEKGLPGRRTSG